MKYMTIVRTAGTLLVGLCCMTINLVAQGGDPVLVGAGDVAGCDSSKLVNPQATATLLDSISGTVFAAGDLAYQDGAEVNFSRCYDPTWGRHRARTKPIVGNHEYQTPGAVDYYNYFGPAAGDPTKGYYSFDLGTWHIVVINSECSQVGGCTSTSPQATWLQADLAAHPTTCTLALWHRPLFTSSSNTAASSMKPIWQVLFNNSADVVINGHAHNYERFAPQDPNGVANSATGIREFVVGTGGESHGNFDTVAANSEIRNNTTYGVLKVTLHSTSYDWQFVPIASQTFTDSGSGSCH
ncbi:MAG: alkaline phosphatase [Acidobacteria bacterium]|nr:MAG: alkaline phosphatase [Acidobacteriota bacterium]